MMIIITIKETMKLSKE
jgi:hypothetical protein